MFLRLFVVVLADHWTLSLVPGGKPFIPELPSVEAFFVQVYRNEEHAKSAIGRLSMLFLEVAARNPTLDMREIVITGIDTFKRSKAA